MGAPNEVRTELRVRVAEADSQKRVSSRAATPLGQKQAAAVLNHLVCWSVLQIKLFVTD